jgi:hypothetical protein
MFRVSKYNSIAKSAANSKNRTTTSSRRPQQLDPLEKLPPIDHKTVLGVINKLYSRGLFKKPQITSNAGVNVLETFRSLLPDA